MTITRERFSQGMSYEECKSKMPRNRELLEQIERQLALSAEDLAPFRSLPQSFDVLVLALDPCPDVATNLPILERIAKETGKLNLRFFMRDDNKDLMAEFMNGPYESVPVFAFYDPAFNLRSVFIERPKSVTDVRAQKTREIHSQHPEFGPVGGPAGDLADDVRDRLRQAVYGMRADTQDFYVKETINDLRDLAKELGKSASDGAAKWRGNLLAVPA